MRRLTCLTAAAFFAVSSPFVLADEPLTDLTREEIEVIVRDYLVEHPEVVIEALRAYERQSAELEAAEAAKALSELTDELYNDPDTPIGGNPDGEIVIVEFFDYRCGYCRRSSADLFAVRDDADDVKVIYKEFPILGDASTLASRAALASRNQELYEPFHEALMEADIGFSQAEIMAVAADVGLDTDQLARDMEDPEIDAYLARTYELARALGVNGTPAFIVNGTLYPGALSRSDLEQLVEAGRS
jgi:protein-disulfide isomerase